MRAASTSRKIGLRPRPRRLREPNLLMAIPSANVVAIAAAVAAAADAATDAAMVAAKPVAMDVGKRVAMDASAGTSRVSPGLPPRVRRRRECRNRVERSSLDRLRDISQF